jgi:hypothetical protein
MINQRCIRIIIEDLKMDKLIHDITIYAFIIIIIICIIIGIYLLFLFLMHIFS